MRQLEFPENIQAIVGGKEYSLDNAVLKIWPESEETKGALCVEMEGVGLFTIANNLNQYAKKANETGKLYEEDIAEIKMMNNEQTELLKKALEAVIHLYEEDSKKRK